MAQTRSEGALRRRCARAEGARAKGVLRRVRVALAGSQDDRREVGLVDLPPYGLGFRAVSSGFKRIIRTF